MTAAVVTLVLYRSAPEHVAAALQALAEQRPPVRVLVHVNDDSAGAVADDVRRKAPASLELDVTGDGANIGFAAGHNRLLARAFADGAELAVVHNPDLLLAPDAVELLRLAVAQSPVPVLAGPLLEQADATTLVGTGRLDSAGIRWSGDGRHFDAGQGRELPVLAAPVEVPGISGACLAVPRAAYQAVLTLTGEFFDEDFFAYREDAELCFRAGLVGVRSLLVPAATGLHVRRQRGTVRGRDAAVDLLGVRNRLLLAAKYGRHRPGRGPLPWLRDAVVLAAVVVRERSSLPGVGQAWALRQVMRSKGRRALRAAASSPAGRP